MVTPRLPFVQSFDRALVRQQARVGGLVQRGVVVDVNDLYSPALCTVQVELRNGQTARVPNVQVLSTSYDPANPPAAPRAGQRVLLLCPTGRALDLCFVMGLATTGKFLFENLRNPNVGTLRLTTRRNFTTTLLLTPPNGATAIEIRGVEMAVASGLNAEPTVVVDGRTTFRAPRAFQEAEQGLAATGVAGWSLPKVILAGTFRQGVSGGVTQPISLVFHGQPALSGVDWEYRLYTTNQAAQASSPGGTGTDADTGVSLAGGAPYPLMAVFGEYVF